MRRRGLVVAGVLLVLLLAAGGVVLATGGGDPVPTAEGGSGFGGGPAEPEVELGLLDALAPLLSAGRSGGTAVTVGAPRPDPREATRGRLPLPAARAAARLMLVGFAGTTPDAPFFKRLGRRGWGGVVLERGNFAGAQQVGELARQVTTVAKEAGHGAPLVAALQPGGEGTAFPGFGPREPSLVASPAEARREAARSGRRLRQAGVALTLAPVASLGSAGGPWEGRVFSDDPARAAQAVRAAVDGYRSAATAAVVGSFPGEGAATQDPAEGIASVGLSLDELRAADLRPFAAVADRAPAVQMSAALYVAWDGVTPATLLPEAVEELRRTGFRGVVVSADLTSVTLATGGGVGEAAVQALQAGCDLVWVPGDLAAQEEAYRAVLQALRREEIDPEHVAAALGRISRLKRQYSIR